MFLTLVSCVSYAQHICGTDLWVNEQIQKDPSFEQTVIDNWNKSNQYTNPSLSVSSARALDIIPVVVHVIHDNGVGNISYDQIQDAIRILNEDFRRINSDTGSTNAIFKPFAADSEIEFRLAKIDPNGDCTNGVVRINEPNSTYDATNSVKSVSYWPSNKYMNIWVINSIANFSGNNGTILGYAQFPGSGSWTTYGVVMRHDQFGSIGTSNADGRTLTHEMGHCLNLLHTFQSSCGNNCSNSGDYVCDTPPSFEATYGCTKSQNSCSNDAVGSSSVYGADVVDQIENYMSYDNCQNMFTFGQKSRMKSALSSFSTLQNLISLNNLVATGTDNTIPQLCAAEFSSNTTVICAGGTIDFEDLSFDGVTSHAWTFSGGFPAASADEAPTIQYNTPGVYDVTLQVGNGVSNVQSTKTQYIVVLPAIGKQFPIEEGFESTADYESDWYPENLYQGLNWEISSANAATGNQSLKLNNFGYEKGQVELISPAYDITNLQGAKFEFKRAFAQVSSTNFDRLIVQFSPDCGENWLPAWSRIGAQVATTPTKTGAYNTVNSNDWKNEIISIPDSLRSESFRVKFIFANGRGNNLYLDDINISGALVVQPLLQYPANGQTGLPATVKLDWKAASASDFYELKLDTSLSFTSPALVNINNPYLGTSSSGVDTEHEVVNLIPDATYYWKVRITQGGSSFAWSDTWSFKVDQYASAYEVLTAINSVSIYPNPAKNQTNVQLELENSAGVKVEAMDVLGRFNKTVFSGELSNGIHEINVNLQEWPKGIYLIRIFADDDVLVRRFIIQ